MAVNKARKSFKGFTVFDNNECVQSQDEFCIRNLHVASDTENQSILICMYKSCGSDPAAALHYNFLSVMTLCVLHCFSLINFTHK